jgi:SH3-like domain-containing protein
MNRGEFLRGAFALYASVALAQPGQAQESQADEAAPVTKSEDKPRDPNKGSETNLPLPRYVTLKGAEGNARRGPGLTHRIDWVFTRPGMPLRITAEYEHWRRVEDSEGMGGWVHYTLLSGVRSVLVTQDLAEFRANPDPNAEVVFQAELGVIGRLLACNTDWCRISTDGEKGWVQKTALWGVDPDEILQ